MKKPVLLAILVLGVLLMSSFTVLAKPENAPGQLKEKNPDAPGQWKKTIQYANQSDFVYAVHLRIWERLQLYNVSPPGLMRLLSFLIELTSSDTDDESEEKGGPPEELEEIEELEEELPEGPEEPVLSDEPEDPYIPDE